MKLSNLETLPEYFSTLRNSNSREITWENILDYFGADIETGREVCPGKQNILSVQLDTWCRNSHKIILEDYPDDTPLWKWMENNMTGLWHEDCREGICNTFYFEIEYDAILFKLRV